MLASVNLFVFVFFALVVQGAYSSPSEEVDSSPGDLRMSLDADHVHRGRIQKRASNRGFKLFASTGSRGKHGNQGKKCEITGNIAIRHECRRYHQCPVPGAYPSTFNCPVGKHFDHKRRICLPKDVAACKDICPDDSTTYPDPRSNDFILQCKDGVATPTRKVKSVPYTPSPKQLYKFR